MASESEGWACRVATMSGTVASIFMASVASAMSSVARGPRI